MRTQGLFLSASLVICLAVLFCFSPRFVLFSGLHLPPVHKSPEVNRAVAAEQQVLKPFAPIESQSNKAIKWRLFFPLLGHYTGLPFKAYLAIPLAGCILCVWLMMALCHARTGSRPYSIAVAAGLAATSWFFVSTGWLAYFDSWYLMGLLLASLAGGRPALLAACLVTPWIDERFVLALPAALAVRMLAAGRLSGGETPAPGGMEFRPVPDTALCLAALSPYLALRLISLAVGGDPGTSEYLGREVHFVFQGLGRYGEGLWQGLRAGWAYVLFCLGWYLFRRRLWASLLLAVACLYLLFLGKAAAGDYSRSLSWFLPLALWGAVLLRNRGKKIALAAAFVILAANLVLPASHVTRTFVGPIARFPTELANWKNPPDILRPEYYDAVGGALFNKGELDRAALAYGYAIAMDARNPRYYLNRGIALAAGGRIAEGRVDLEKARDLAPEASPVRARAGEILGQIAGAGSPPKGSPSSG